MAGCQCAEPGCQVTDWGRGDVVCQGCGVVLESHILDDAAEWVDAQPARGPGIRCIVENASLEAGLAMVNRCVSQFGLTTSSNVAQSARQLFEDVHALKRHHRDPMAAAGAAVYFGFKFEGHGRELQHVSAVCGVDMRTLHAAVTDFKDLLRDKAYYPKLFTRLRVSMLLGACIDRLGLPPDQRRRLWRAAHQVDEDLAGAMDCSRKPRTLCSAVVWLAVRRERLGVDKRDVAAACSVCPQTIDKILATLTTAVGV